MSKEKQAIILSVQRVAAKLGKVPTLWEFIDENYEINKHDIYNSFGNWNELLEAAGLQTRRRRRATKCVADRDKLIAQVKDMADKLGRTPTKAEFNSCPYTASSETIVRHFGTWNKFVEVAGLRVNQQTSTYLADEEMINQLKMLTAELERVPKCREFIDDKRTASYTAIRKHFGSWGDFVKAAGL